MQDKFRTQFENLRKIINTNIDTLRSLIEQSDQLSQLIDELNGNPNVEGNAQKSKELKKVQSGIYKSIETLVKQNEQLFEAYKEMLDNAFKK